MRNIWLGMRHALLTLVVVALVVVVTMWQLAGAERRWLVTANGVVLVPRYDSARFFQDSVLVVDLDPNDARRYPIRLSGYYAGSRVPIAEREIARVMREVAGERRGARVTATRTSRLLPLPVPSVTIAYDFWDDGGVRADIIVACQSFTAGTQGARVASDIVSSSRSRLTDSDELRALVTRDLSQAAETRCPRDQPRYVERPDGGDALVDPMKAPLTAMREIPLVVATAPRASRAGGGAGVEVDTASSTSVAGDRALLLQAARRDSLIAEAMAGARAAFYSVTEIRVQPDTVRLAVGEEVRAEQALRLTALRRDGSIVDRFAPLYIVEDLSVARMSAGRFKGLTPGTTVVTIRPFMPGPTGMPEGGARAQVVLKVAP